MQKGITKNIKNNKFDCGHIQIYDNRKRKNGIAGLLNEDFISIDYFFKSI
jgi:hypothetical protein